MAAEATFVVEQDLLVDPRLADNLKRLRLGRKVTDGGPAREGLLEERR